MYENYLSPPTGFAIVYVITRLDNSRRYVGCTKNELGTRFAEHVAQGTLQTTDRSLLSIEAVEICSLEQASRREGHWIAKLGTDNSAVGFNRFSGGRIQKRHYERAGRKGSGYTGRLGDLAGPICVRTPTCSFRLSRELIEGIDDIADELTRRHPRGVRPSVNEVINLLVVAGLPEYEAKIGLIAKPSKPTKAA